MLRRLALLALLAVSTAAAQVEDPARGERPACPGAVVVTRAEIEAAGVVYLSDLLRLLPPLRRLTLDGFSWRAAAGSGAPFADAPFLVLVDGVPADLDFLGEADLEGLPVPIPDLARVTYCPVAEPAAGVWAGGGTLRLETRPATVGLTSRGSWQIGNETGDPGPFRYTDRGTPNVDKSGPDVEGAFRYGAARPDGPAVAGRADLRVLRFYATDPAITLRTGTATRRPGTNQRIITTALRGEAGVSGAEPAARHAFALAGRYVSDLFFLEGAGRELPLRRLDAHADALGPLFSGLRYRVAAHLQGADDEDAEIAGFDPRWRRRSLTTALYDGTVPEQPGLHYGASVTHTDASGAGLTPDGFTLGTAYGGYVRPGPLGSRTTLALTTTGGALGAKATQTLGLTRGPAHLALTAALDRRLPEEAPGYGFWRARGLTGLERPAVTYTPALPVPRTEGALRLDAHYATAAVQVQGGAHAWAGRGLYVERPALGLADDATTAVGAVAAVPDAHGGALGAWARATAARGLWHGEAWYSLLAPLGGSSDFRETWARVPRHRAGAAVTLRPDPGFSLRASFEAQSATRWPGYAALSGATTPDGYGYTDGTPALALLDLAVEKGLWDRRARVSLLFRNLLNTEERYHPLGAALDFRLYARITAGLGGPLWIGPRSRSEE